MGGEFALGCGGDLLLFGEWGGYSDRFCGSVLMEAVCGRLSSKEEVLSDFIRRAENKGDLADLFSLFCQFPKR
jgi:hypothetical protein